MNPASSRAMAVQTTVRHFPRLTVVSGRQPALCILSDLSHFRRRFLWAIWRRRANPWRIPIGPGAFDNHMPNPAATSFCYRTSPDRITS